MANGAIRLTWRDRNWAEQGRYIYRSQTPMNVNNLPNPLTTVDGNVTEYIDYDVIADQTYYYRIGAYRNNDVMVSDEIEVVATPSTLGTHDIFGDGSSVATYQFNGSVIDLGGLYNGQWVGNEIYVDTPMNKGAYFDGNNRITLPYNSLADTFDYGNNHTISFWTSGDFGLFFTNSIGNTGFGITTNGGKDGDLSAMYLPLPGNSSGNYYRDEQGGSIFGTTIENNTHLVIVKDSDTSIRIYKNGIFQNSVVKDFNGTGNINENVIGVGGTQYDTYPAMKISNGDIDQLRLFNRALSDNEINILYQEGIA